MILNSFKNLRSVSKRNQACKINYLYEQQKNKSLNFENQYKPYSLLPECLINSFLT